MKGRPGLASLLRALSSVAVVSATSLLSNDLFDLFLVWSRLPQIFVRTKCFSINACREQHEALLYISKNDLNLLS